MIYDGFSNIDRQALSQENSVSEYRCLQNPNEGDNQSLYTRTFQPPNRFSFTQGISQIEIN